MKLSTQPVKGARDFYPQDMRLQKYIFKVWRSACEKFGYEEYDAPILESTDLYLNKGNQEIIDEQTYTFEDRGGRSLTVRTEMTPSVSRMVAGKRQELGYPLRLYSIPQCWRYERMQRGRGREFYQLNADLFGWDGVGADVELVQLSDAIMQEFGAARDMYQINVNSRKLVDYLLQDVLSLDDSTAASVRTLIDKKEKMPSGDFKNNLQELLDAGQTEAVVSFLASSSLDELPASVAQHASVANLRQFISDVQALGVSNLVFDPALMRGFDYYTDIAFEVFDTNPENNRSLFGGGRYEGLVGMFGGENVSAVGFGMGDITLHNFLDSHDLLPHVRPATDVYLCGLTTKARQVAAELRSKGINVALDLTERKLDKQFKTAQKHSITYALVVGDSEIENGSYTLKNLSVDDIEDISISQVAEHLRASRDSN